MPRFGCINGSMQYYLNEFTSRIVAKTGITTDRFHLGKMILQALGDAPDFVLQINGATGESETFKSVLRRTIECSLGLKKMGLKKGDVMLLLAPTHIDLTIPLYAALYLGIIVTAVDIALSTRELQLTLNVVRPKIIFCQSEGVANIEKADDNLCPEAFIVTFDKKDGFISFSDVLNKMNNDKNAIDEFMPAEFDAEEAVAFLFQSSGTTGLPKAIAVTHKNFSITGPIMWSRYTTFPTPTRLALVASPLHWVTAYMHLIMSPILRYTRLHSSSPFTEDNAYSLINTYKPTMSLLSPNVMFALMKPGARENCDFSSFEMIMLGGAPVSKELIDEIKIVMPNVKIEPIYGLSEVSGICFFGDFPPPDSCGKPIGVIEFRLVNIETQEDIEEPYVKGELWLKGPGIFKEYYNDPTLTAKAFAKNRWFKTGDLFYRDENFYFYFVERIKLLLKYNLKKVSPAELEAVIRKNPGVLDVAVIGIPDPKCGDLPTACIVLRNGYTVTAKEIKNLVLEHLSETKKLAGGVIFMKELPMNVATKVDRRKLKEMALHVDR